MRMSQNDGLNRRSFLRNAGLTALVGAVAPGSSLASAAGAALVPAADTTKFDFDTPYSRIGTDSTKWDGPINTGLTDKDHIVAGMGIADMDFRAAPAITQALQERMKHDVWGYMIMPKSFPEGIVAWNKKRYGITIDPALLDHSTAVRQPAEQGDRQQQPDLQGGEQVVRPRGDEVRVVLQHQQGSVRGYESQQPRRPDDARHDREQGGLCGRRGLAEPVRRLRQRQP